MPHSLHLVCGLPAVGKTTYGKQLAKELNAVFLDSDTVSDLLIQAAHKAAGYDPHDRDSPRYKETYRNAVYETLFCLAEENLSHLSVVLVGPFTAESRDTEGWKLPLASRFPDAKISIHHLTLPEEERLKRMQDRGALRDITKLS